MLYTCPASDATPLKSVLCLLLQTLQGIQKAVDSQSLIVPVFLKFLGYDGEKPTR